MTESELLFRLTFFVLNYAAFHQCLHCLLRLKQHSGPEIHLILDKSTYGLFKYIMGSPILIAPICIRKSIRIHGLSNWQSE